MTSPAVGTGGGSGRVVPWYLWCAALAVTSAYIGGYWDISWHRSIGRDAFWSAPHVAIYACGVLAGLSSAYLIFSTTFSAHTPLRPVSVRIWGLRGPLGAFVSAWGGVAMLASAPFDNWWHQAYGLDVRIVSPPHMVLAAGFFGINVGTVILMLAFTNRAAAASRRPLQGLLLYVAAMGVCESLLLKLEYTSRVQMHTAGFYTVVIFGTLAMVVAVAVASGHRWGCTVVTGIYTACDLAFLWILPLFPASPKLGPVYRTVTHFIPWEFPLLVVIPALAVDLVLQRTAARRPLLRALVVGLVFFATFIAVQWPFATFLMSPMARNALFGAAYMDFSTPPTSLYARHLFIPPDAPGRLAVGLAVAAATSWAMAYVGLRVSRAMQRVRR